MNPDSNTHNLTGGIVDEFEYVRNKLSLSTLLDVLTALVEAKEVRAMEIVYRMYLRQGGTPLPIWEAIYGQNV
jgi:hypothetical protein